MLNTNELNHGMKCYKQYVAYYFLFIVFPLERLMLRNMHDLLVSSYRGII